MRHDSNPTTYRCAPAVATLALLAGLALAMSPASAQSPAPSAEPPATTPAPSTMGDDLAVAPLAVADAGVAPSAADSLNDRMQVSSKRVKFTKQSDNVVRSGPGSAFAIVGVYPKNASFTVIARSGEYYGIRLSDTETGWVHESLCKELDDLSGLEFKPNPKLYTRTGTFVLSGYAGAYAFDRKSNSLVLGGRLGYYVFDRIRAEAGVGWTHVQRPAEIVESLFALSLEAEDFHMLFYQLNLTYEVLPGRQMVPYASGGVGSTIMLGKAEPSVNFGVGTTLFLSKRSAMRWEVRDYRFSTGPDAARTTTNNIEFTFGTDFLF